MSEQGSSNERCPHGISLTNYPTCHFCTSDRVRLALSHLLSHVDRPRKEIIWCDTAIEEACAAIDKANLNEPHAPETGARIGPLEPDNAMVICPQCTRGPSTPLDKARAIRASLKAIERRLVGNREKLEAINDWRRARMLERALSNVRAALSEAEQL